MILTGFRGWSWQSSFRVCLSQSSHVVALLWLSRTEVENLVLDVPPARVDLALQDETVQVAPEFVHQARSQASLVAHGIWQ